MSLYLTYIHTLVSLSHTLQLLLAAATAMGPLIRRFIFLGLNRVWLKSGDVAYRQGERHLKALLALSLANSLFDVSLRRRSRVPLCCHLRPSEAHA